MTSSITSISLVTSCLWLAIQYLNQFLLFEIIFMSRDSKIILILETGILKPTVE